MQKKKTIVLDQNFIPNITSIEETKQETQMMIDNIYNRFMNEKNYNNKEDAKKFLEEYRYIHKNWIIPLGRHIKCIRTNNPYNMVVGGGGFVMDCDKYSFLVLNTKYGKFRIDRKSTMVFMKLNNDDYMRCALDKI